MLEEHDCPWCGLPVEVDWRGTMRESRRALRVVLYRCLSGEHRWPEVDG